MTTIDSTIYTYGGFEIMVRVLEAVAAIFQHKGFINISVATAVIVGTVMVTFNIVQKKDVLDAVKWGTYASLILVTLIANTSRVKIYDTVTERQRVVANVPNLISIIGGVTSSVGYFSTKLFDMAFSVVGTPEYHKNGLAFTAYARSKLNKIDIVDPQFKNNMDAMIRQCVVYQVNIGKRYNLRDLINAQDLWGFLKERSSSIFHFHYVGEVVETTEYGEQTKHKINKIVSCKQGMSYLEAHWQHQIEQSMSDFASHLFNFVGAKSENKKYHEQQTSDSQQKVNQYVKDKINLAFTNTSGLKDITESAEQLIKQQIMIKSIRGLGDSDGFINQRAMHSTVQSYKSIGDMAGAILPNLRVLIQALLYSSIVFSFFLMMLPNGYMILLNLLFAMFWIETWGPIYSVLNMIISMSSDLQNQVVGSLTLRTVSRLITNDELLSATASNMMMLVPYLGWILTKGGVGSLVHLASNLTGGAAAAASAASAEANSGNFSAGNMDFFNEHYNTRNNNSHDTAVNYHAGSLHSIMSDGAAATITSGGSAIYQGGAGYDESSGNTKMVLDDTFTNSLELRRSEEQSFLESQSKEYSQAETSNIHATSDFISAYANSKQSGTAWNIDQSTSEGKALNKVLDISESIQEKINDESYNATTYGMNGSVKGTIPLGKAVDFVLSAVKGKPFSEASKLLGLEGGLSASKDFREMLQDTYHEAQDQLEKEGISFNQEDMYRLAKQQNFNDHNSEEYRATESVVTSYEKMQQNRESMTATKQNIDNIGQVVNQIKSGAIDLSRDYTGHFHQWLEKQNFGGEPIDSLKAYELIHRSPVMAKHFAARFMHDVSDHLVNNVSNQQAGEDFEQRYNNVDYSSKIDKQDLDVAPNTINNLRAEHNVGKDKIDYQIREQADQQMHEQRAEIALQEQQMQNNKLHRQKELKSEKETVKNQQKELEDAN
jgi:conjugal transfer mating pair stabilization protein TraG